MGHGDMVLVYLNTNFQVYSRSGSLMMQVLLCSAHKYTVNIHFFYKKLIYFLSRNPFPYSSLQICKLRRIDFRFPQRRPIRFKLLDFFLGHVGLNSPSGRAILKMFSHFVGPVVDGANMFHDRRLPRIGISAIFNGFLLPFQQMVAVDVHLMLQGTVVYFKKLRN